MAKDNKKKVEQITDMEVDFAQWYTDVCKKAELIDYSSIKGMFIYRPYGYAIWENIQARYWTGGLRRPATRTCTCPSSSPSPCCRRRRTMWRASPPSAPGSPTAAARSWRSATASGPPPRPCSASTIKTSSTPTGTCPSCTTSGAPSCGGRRPPAPSCATGNSCGRRATPCTPPPRRPGQETEQMLNIYADFLENVPGHARGQGAARPTRRSSTAPRRPTP